jgi:hypothetical protein
MDLATKNRERLIVDRRREPAVVIMSVQDFIRTAPRSMAPGTDSSNPSPSSSESANHRFRDRLPFMGQVIR